MGRRGLTKRRIRGQSRGSEKVKNLPTCLSRNDLIQLLHALTGIYPGIRALALGGEPSLEKYPSMYADEDESVFDEHPNHLSIRLRDRVRGSELLDFGELALVEEGLRRIREFWDAPRA